MPHDQFVRVLKGVSEAVKIFAITHQKYSEERTPPGEKF
jgi:hypothetical protein